MVTLAAGVWEGSNLRMLLTENAQMSELPVQSYVYLPESYAVQVAQINEQNMLLISLLLITFNQFN